MAVQEKEYLSVAETAKLVRAALKRAFPETKFSVRSKKYSGGASIDVSYVDGPTGKAVREVIEKFAGAGFDGMIDLKYGVEHFLLPDGSVRFARQYGHSFDNPVAPYDMDDMPPGTRRVHFGADYVFAHRSLSPEVETTLKAEIMAAAILSMEYEDAATAEFDYNGEYDVAVIDGEAKPCGGLQHYQRYGSGILNELAAVRSF